jgi:LysR family hydrogen peroxide-inducible transcriptional activator
MTMELRQLQTLVAIADHGSFSAAAKALATVQSNVSAHLARLEKQLGTPLVERATGTLTDEGELVVARARRILHEIEDIDGDIHSLGQSPTGECRLGSIGTTARWLIPPMLLGLERTHPAVRVTLLEGATSSLLPRIAAMPFGLPHWGMSVPLAALAALTLRLVPEAGAAQGLMQLLGITLLATTALVLSALVLGTVRGLRDGSLLAPELAAPIVAAASPADTPRAGGQA